jgi:NHS family xanthosine MFS transporter
MFLNFKEDNIGSKIGATYGTMGIASLFMPAIVGIIADKFLRAELVLAICHLFAGIFIYYAGTVTTASEMMYAIFLVSCFYMPTIALSNSVSFSLLSKNNFDIQKTFSPIRVWGTVGFIVAEWTVDLMGWTGNNSQFKFAALIEFITALYCLSLPSVGLVKNEESKSIISRFGLDAFQLFKENRMAIFFIFSALLGAALQVTNMFGSAFLQNFANVPEYSDTFAVKHSVVLISLSQVSETLFILTLPFFLKRFGIKVVMLISMLAWVFRFYLFGIGNPGPGLHWLILSMIVYGMAFDFFNISGSLFVDKEAPQKIRNSAQGLFMVMTNGVGGILGGIFAGKVVDYYTDAGVVNWNHTWFAFSAYALVLTILFWIFFKYEHIPEDLKDFKH